MCPGRHVFRVDAGSFASVVPVGVEGLVAASVSTGVRFWLVDLAVGLAVGLAVLCGVGAYAAVAFVSGLAELVRVGV